MNKIECDPVVRARFLVPAAIVNIPRFLVNAGGQVLADAQRLHMRNYQDGALSTLVRAGSEAMILFMLDCEGLI